MRIARLIFALWASCATALTPLSADSAASNGTAKPASKKFVIEAGQGANLDTLSAKIIAANGTILTKYDSPIFRGFSVEASTDNVDTLEALSEIAKAWPVTRIRLSPGNRLHSFSNDASAQNYSVHKWTGVDQLHAAGIKGKGAVVAIVDTGTQWSHPALGSGYGPGFKVAGGYDLVGDDIWPNTPKAPDDDPYDNLGHGTHVAGILAGESEWFTGVAPEATILSYKVFSVFDWTDDATLIEAFLMAYDAGADIITSSVGGVNGFSDGPWATVASRLVEQGVVVTMSAGNEGADGPFFGGNGALGKNVLAVASTDPGTIAALPFSATFTLDGSPNTTNLAYFPAGAIPWDNVNLPVFPLLNSDNTPSDGCGTLPSGTSNLTGVIVLVSRGGCSFADKQTNLEQSGAKHIFVFNDDSEQPVTTPNAPSQLSQLALIEEKAGEAIISTVQAGGNVTASVTTDTSFYVGAYNSAGGIPSEVTSWGGSFELEVKPDIAAPGREILSTVPENGWALMSGTSMACPYVAGVAALYISKHGGRKVHGSGIAKKIVNAIRASGGAVKWQVAQPSGLPVEYGFWAPVPQVGSGLVNALKVLNYTTSLQFEPIALNDTGHLSRFHKVDVTNGGTSSVTYTFALQPAGGFNAQSPSNPSFLAYYEELQPFEAVPSVSFPSGSFTVRPGDTRTAQFNFSPPAGLNEAMLPIYSGKILVSGSNGESLSVPYFGAAFDLKKQMRQTLFSDTTPFQKAGPNREDIDTFRSYDFDLAWAKQNFPRIVTEFKWGVKQLRWDIFEAGWRETRWRYPPVVGNDGYVGSATYWNSSGEYWAFDPSWQDKEATTAFPVLGVPRTGIWSGNKQEWWWFGKLANGSYIRPGNYTFRFAALTPFSNPDHSNNWDIWDTPQVTVYEQSTQ